MRPDGFYWVRVKGRGDWEVAEFIDTHWFTTGSDFYYDDGDMEEIGGRVVRP